MRIAQVAPPFETVPPERYGGTERVVSALTEELVRRGHDVTLIAARGSRTAARLVPTIESALWLLDPPPADTAPGWSITVDQLWQHVNDFDLVHSHIDCFGFPVAHASSVPVLTTPHNRIDLPDRRQLFAQFADVPLVAISEAQRRTAPCANWVGVVHNGINLDEFTFRPNQGDYLVFLGRISPDKGLDVAIRVARKSGLPLRIAARLPLQRTFDPNAERDAEFMDTVVKPLLDGPGVEFVGQVNGSERDELLRNAAALLFPVSWPEPFGLVMVEALACGTPVIALRAGSVPEVVRNGVSGFVCDTEEEMVAAVERIGEIDRLMCRHEVEHRFSAEAMADRYERVYEQFVEERSDVFSFARLNS
jgi:glycosyltransferase involved in cell wall biosynthesis